MGAQHNPAQAALRAQTGSLRSVVALVVIFALGLVVYQAFLAWRSLEAARERAGIQAAAAAQIISQHMAWTVRAADIMLRQAASLTDGRPMPALANDREAWQSLRSLIDGQPEFAALCLIDAAGRVALSTEALPAAPHPAQPALAQLTRARQDGLQIGGAIRLPRTEVHAFTISRQVLGPQGGFSGLAVALVATDPFSHFLDRLDLVPGTLVTVSNAQGSVVSRTVIGAAAHAGAAPGDALRVQRTVPRLLLTITITQPLTVMVARWWHETRRDAAGLLLALAGLATMGFVVIRAVRRERLALAVAESANAANSRFLAAASHDLRQPFQAMRLLHHLLTEQLASATAVETARKLGDTLTAAEGLLNALLDVSTIETGVAPLQIQPVELGAVLMRLAEQVQPQAEAKGLALRLVPSRLWANSEPVLLERILRNLVDNAIRYTERGRILIGCRRRGDRLRIEIWDTGIGIPRDQLSLIFEEFRQVGNSHRDRARGLGLGLAVVRRAARLLGHRVGVRSREAAGSVFWIELPQAAPARPGPAAPSRRMPTPAPARHRRALVVEDDPLQREALQALLESWGWSVLAVEDSGRALHLVIDRGERPDLILTDMRLPGPLSGLELVGVLRQRLGQALPALVVTGDTAGDHVQEASGLGVVLLYKPVAPTALRKAIEQVARAAAA